MTDLSELLARVKSATGPDRELDYAVGLASGYYREADWPTAEEKAQRGDNTVYVVYRHPEYKTDWHGSIGACVLYLTASVDAALAFAERVLPGWEWLKKSPGVITLYRPLTEQEDAGKAWATHFDASGATIPLAIIAATLIALIAQEHAQ